MDPDAFGNAMGLLAVVAVVAGLVAVAGRVTDRPRWVPDAERALTFAFGIAAVATGGSLIFSEVHHYTPCELCWYQRIAMYPLAVVLGIAAVRRDLDVRRYALPLAGGAPVDLARPGPAGPRAGRHHLLRGDRAVHGHLGGGPRRAHDPHHGRDGVPGHHRAARRRAPRRLTLTTRTSP